jgi:hypothetical protein
MELYKLKADVLPNLAHVVKGVGFVKINSNLSDKQVEKLIEKGFDRYFEQVTQPITQDEDTIETTDGADTDTGGDDPDDGTDGADIDPQRKNTRKGVGKDSRKKSGKGGS